MGCGISTVSGMIEPVKIVTLNSFTLVRAIGKGGFGKVCIVERKTDKAVFALKYSDKEKSTKSKALYYIIQERNILEDVHHPFICAMRYSFQDNVNLYMVLDFMAGGDLRFHLKVNKRVSEDAAVFIMAEIACALHHLHQLNIVHRDVKPDNILLDREGHAHLSDFNVAVQYKEGKPLKSIAGTEPYMAPEMLNTLGYYESVDWWSLGVTLFECLFGERPFRSKQRRELIKKGKWKFPVDASKYASDKCLKAISDFLRCEPSKRLGRAFEEGIPIQNHELFKSFNWDRLQNKQVSPVFVPPISDFNNQTDIDIEELMQHNKDIQSPLHYNPPSNLDTISDFLYYDYTVMREAKPSMVLASFPHSDDSNNVAQQDFINTRFDTNNQSFTSNMMMTTQRSVMGIRRSSVNSKSLTPDYKGSSPIDGRLSNGVSSPADPPSLPIDTTNRRASMNMARRHTVGGRNRIEDGLDGKMNFDLPKVELVHKSEEATSPLMKAVLPGIQQASVNSNNAMP